MNTNTDRARFNEALTSLIEYSHANAGHVSSEDIKIHFKDIIEDSEHFNAIYEYLRTSGITIDDVESTNEADNTNISNSDTHTPDSNGQFAGGTLLEPHNISSESEKQILEIYRQEVDSVANEGGNTSELITLAKAGDSDAINTLIELHLPTVIEIASEYDNASISMGDLIQEGNLGLTTAVYELKNAGACPDNDKLDNTDNLKSDNLKSDSLKLDNSHFDKYIRDAIRNSIEVACDMQNHSNLVGNRLANQLNELDNASSRLTSLLGNAPSKEELAKEMHISEDEVDILLRTSLNVLTVDAEKNAGSEEANDDEEIVGDKRIPDDK